MKVLHVLSQEKPAFYFSNLVDHLEKHDIEFVFANFSKECEFAETMRERGCRIYNLGELKKSTLPVSAIKLWKVLKAEHPAIVHTHLFNPTYLGLYLAKRFGAKAVVTRHHSDALHALTSRSKRWFYLNLEKQNNERADHIITPSRMVRECVVEWEGTSADKVSVIPYPQTSERFDAVTQERVTSTRRELGMDRQLSLVCVSRLFHRKGHKFLFEALAPLIKEGLEVKLYLVGSGAYKSTLEELAIKLGITNQIEFLGWQNDVLEILASADIVVHPSLEDALSQSLIESLMLGRPIVATDISGASDTLADGKYGRLVRPADSTDLQAALKETIEGLPHALERAGHGREYLLDYMDADRVTAEYSEIYRKLIGNLVNGDS